MKFLPLIAIRRIIIAALVAAFFAAYAFFGLSGQAGYASPDENANAFFADAFAVTNRLWSYEAVNYIAENLVHPRSTRVVDGFLVPGGFIGLPVIEGLFAKMIGFSAMPLLMAALAVLAAFAFGSVVAKFSGCMAGDAATLLLLAHPVWWYWSTRPFMPNAPFLVFLIFAALFFFIMPMRGWLERMKAEKVRLLRHTDPVIAGAFLAAAVAIRPSEIPWLAFAVVAALVFGRKRVDWLDFGVFSFATLAFFVPFAMLHVATYGSLSSLGYVVDAASSAAPGGRVAMLLGPFAALFPLGFSPSIAASHALTFGIGLFWWWSLIVAASLVFLYAKKPRPAAAPFFGAAVFVAAWLIMFYGSWLASDRPDGAVTIGSSLIRYWLPLFVLSIVPVAVAASRWLATMKGKQRVIVAATLAVAYIAVSGATVFFSREEGLMAVRAHLRMQQDLAEKVFAKTEPKSIIIVDYADKYLFPRRAVIQPLRSEYTYSVIGRMAVRLPLYYFGITLPQADIEYLQRTKLDPQGVDIVPVATFGEQTLYSLKGRKDSAVKK